MKRYCTKCKEDFEFDIKSMKDLDNLYCPKCGEKIDMESRHPTDPSIARNEETLGKVMMHLTQFAYMFYLIMAAIGIIGFGFRIYTLVYSTTFICLFVFIMQIIYRFETFPTGKFLLPLGALVGFLIFKTLSGICVGILFVFLIRHIIRDIFLGLVWKLVQSSRE